MPIGILGSLVICTVLYILFAHVLTGIAPVSDFRTSGREASVAYAITKHMPGYGWLAKLVTVAILVRLHVGHPGHADGAVARLLLDVARRPRAQGVLATCTRVYRTPWKSNLLFFGFVGLLRRVRARGHRRRHDARSGRCSRSCSCASACGSCACAIPMRRGSSARRWCRWCRCSASSSNAAHDLRARLARTGRGSACGSSSAWSSTSATGGTTRSWPRADRI